jgi:hypothetical protein
MTDISIEDVQSYIRGKSRHPIMSVDGINDPDYKSMKDFVQAINPEADDYMHSITSGMNKILSNLRHMESKDYNNIVATFKKYEVKGTSSGISGKRTYGYDRSRIDGAMIRRKRGN